MGTDDGALRPAENSPIKIPAGAFFAATGDINGDAKPDAVVTHTEGDDRATMLLNDTHGRLSIAPTSPLTIGHNAWEVAITDMNSDGVPDLVFSADTAIRIFLANPANKVAAKDVHFTPAPGSPYATAKGAWRLCVADLNADGKKDIVARCVDAKELVVLLAQ